jgi:serine/threonine-protein kinase
LAPTDVDPFIDERYQEGDRIANKYTLVDVLGRGGMGTVWRAFNEALDVDVAIKLIQSDRNTSSARARLEQEARASAKLGHRAIV